MLAASTFGKLLKEIFYSVFHSREVSLGKGGERIVLMEIDIRSFHNWSRYRWGKTKLILENSTIFSNIISPSL